MFALVFAVVSTALTAVQVSPEGSVYASSSAVVQALHEPPAHAHDRPATGPEIDSALSMPLSAPSTSRSPAPASASWIDDTLEGLTLREKVAQMVMAWIPGGYHGNDAEGRRARRLVEVEKVGGLIVGKGDGLGTVRWLNDLQQRADLPLLVGADLEWGAGTRLIGATEMPVNMAIGATNDLGYAYEAGQLTAREARAAGIHMAFAPVADVNVNAANPVINTRSYGADPVEVAERVAAFVEGAEEAGLLTAAKHFPGHGDTEVDSHLVLPVVAASRARLATVELVPFRAAIAAGVTAIMTAHVAVPVLERDGVERPATLSHGVLTELLRNDMRYEGLIITDGLMMDGVHEGRSSGEIALEAVLAGVDILLMPPATREAIETVVAAVEAGEVSEARIDASVRRILEAKAMVGLPEARLVDLDESRRVLGAEEHLRWAQEVADRSITLVRSSGRLPLTLAGRRVVSVIYADGRRSKAGEPFTEALDSMGVEVQTVRLWRRSTKAELSRVERIAADADVVVFSSFARSVPWKGTLAIPESVAELGDRLAARGALVIGFGDPYLLQQLPRTKTYLVAWSDADVAQRAAARALSGQVELAGRLPIPLPPFHLVGEGIIAPTLAGEPAVEKRGAEANDAVADWPSDRPDRLHDGPEPDPLDEPRVDPEDLQSQALEVLPGLSPDPDAGVDSRIGAR